MELSPINWLKNGAEFFQHTFRKFRHWYVRCPAYPHFLQAAREVSLFGFVSGKFMISVVSSLSNYCFETYTTCNYLWKVEEKQLSVFCRIFHKHLEDTFALSLVYSLWEKWQRKTVVIIRKQFQQLVNDSQKKLLKKNQTVKQKCLTFWRNHFSS